MSWNMYYQGGGRGAGGNSGFRGGFNMQQGPPSGNSFGNRGGGHNYRGGYRQGDRNDFYVNDEVVGGGNNFPARKAPPAHAGHHYSNYGAGGQFMPPQAHGGYGGLAYQGYGYGYSGYGWNDYNHPGYSTQPQQPKDPSKSGDNEAKPLNDQELQGSSSGDKADTNAEAKSPSQHSTHEVSSSGHLADNASSAKQAAAIPVVAPTSPAPSSTSSSSSSAAATTPPSGPRSVTPTNGNSRRKQSTPHKVPGSSTMNIITQKGIPPPPDSPMREVASTPTAKTELAVEGISPLKSIATNLEALKKEAKTTGSSEGDFADKESDDETMVKEKATVRKKRISKADAKGEGSDSSDIDQKEVSPKASPSKSSRSPRLTRTGRASLTSPGAKSSGTNQTDSTMETQDVISPDPANKESDERPQVAAIPKLKKEAETPPQRRRSKGEMKEFPGEASSGQADSPGKKGATKESQPGPDTQKPVTRQSPKKEAKEVYRKLEADLEAMFAEGEDVSEPSEDANPLPLTSMPARILESHLEANPDATASAPPDTVAETVPSPAKKPDKKPLPSKKLAEEKKESKKLAEEKIPLIDTAVVAVGVITNETLTEATTSSMERKSPRFKRKSARDAEMKMKEDPSDDMEELLKEQGKVAYRPEPKKEMAGGAAAVSRSQKNSAADTTAVSPIQAATSQQEPAPKQTQPTKTAARRSLGRLSGVQTKDTIERDNKAEITGDSKAVSSGGSARQRHGSASVKTSATLHPTPEVVPLANPQPPGRVKVPVVETAVEDRTVLSAVGQAGTSASCPPSLSVGSNPLSCPDSSQRRSRRSRSSVSEADQTKDNLKKTSDVEIIFPEASSTVRGTGNRRGRASLESGEPTEETALAHKQEKLHKQQPLDPSPSKKPKLASLSKPDITITVERPSRGSRLPSQQTTEVEEKRLQQLAATTTSTQQGPVEVVRIEESQPVPKPTQPTKPKLGRPPGTGADKRKRGTDENQEILRAGTASRSKVQAGRQERPKGPYVHLEGDVRSPRIVRVVNSSADTTSATSLSKRGICDQEHRARITNFGFSSTLSKQYDYKTVDNSWRCVFCHKKSHYQCLGDLFGPYWVPGDCIRTMPESQKRSRKRKASTSDVEVPSKQLQAGSGASTGEAEIWFHEDCFCWVDGVYLVGSRIVGMEEAVEVCSSTRCSVCHEYGASLGCTRAGCRNAAHVPCGETAGWRTDISSFTASCSNCCSLPLR